MVLNSALGREERIGYRGHGAHSSQLAAVNRPPLLPISSSRYVHPTFSLTQRPIFYPALFLGNQCPMHHGGALNSGLVCLKVIIYMILMNKYLWHGSWFIS